jgi:hypothetical protein
MTDGPKPSLTGLDVGRAIHIRWVLRDIKAKRTQFMPLDPADLRTVVEMGLVEIRDEVPVLTYEGELAIDWR